MKTWKNLWDNFVSNENIEQSIRKASLGKKKRRKDVRKAMENPEEFKNHIKKYASNYFNHKHKEMEIYDGIKRKKRKIIVPYFDELVIQHMIVNVLKPMFLQGVYERSYGSLPGRGSHEAKKYIEKWIKHDTKNCKYCLKLDIRKYFESIPHDILKEKLALELKDERILSLLYEIIDVTDKGLPLGFYTSQWLSMWYLKKFDHYLKEDLGIVHYVRYADDLVIFGSNKRKLWYNLNMIKLRLSELGLSLNERSQLFRFVYAKNGKEYGRDLDFMGFRFFRNRTILRRSIYYKMLRKARKISKKEKPTIYDLRQMMSYLGWIKATDVCGVYLKYIKPFFAIRNAKKRIGRYDRRMAKCGKELATVTA